MKKTPKKDDSVTQQNVIAMQDASANTTSGIMTDMLQSNTVAPQATSPLSESTSAEIATNEANSMLHDLEREVREHERNGLNSGRALCKIKGKQDI